MAVDTDDELAWLEKMSGGNLTSEVRLANARASKARQDGDKETALQQFRIAAEGWAKLPPEAAGLDNGALVHFQLFELTGDLNHYEKGSRMMERAVNLEPENSILALNACSSLFTIALMQTVDGKFHPRLVQQGIGLDMVRFLYDDEAGRATLTAKLTSNPNYLRALDLLEEGLVLAPNSRPLYLLGSGWYSFTLDAAALAKLTEKLEQSQVDTSEEREQAAKFLRGESDEDLRKAREIGLKESEEILAEIDDPRQQDYVRVQISGTRLSGFSLGESPDLDREIAFLRGALAKNPNARIRATLVEALSQKAVAAIAARDAAFGKWMQDSRRVVGATSLLQLGLTGDRYRAAILASPEARKSFLEHQACQDRFPAIRDASDWILASQVTPERSAELRNAVVNNKLEAINIEFQHKLMPWSPGTVLERYKWLLVSGQDAEAQEFLKKARADGIAVPEL